MWRAGLALLLAALPVYAAQTGSPVDPCDASAVMEWVDEAIPDGPHAWAERLTALDAMIGAQTEDECRLMLSSQSLSLLALADRRGDVLARTDAILTHAAVSAYPEYRSMAYHARAQALIQNGQTAEALQTLTEAVQVTRGAPAWQTAKLLTKLADESAASGDWRRADEAQLQALGLLRDSSAADPVRSRARIGRLLGSRAYRFQQQAVRTTDRALRERLARRTLALADSSLSLLDAYRADDPTERAFDAGKRALALIDGAYAQAVLGRHRDAAERIRRARALLAPETTRLFSYIESDYWMRVSQTALMAGRLGESAQAAQQSRDACGDDEDVWCEADGAEQVGRVAEASGSLAAAETAYRRAVVLREIEWDRARLQDWSASAFSSAQMPYRGLTRVLIRQGRTAEAFATLDGARARTMRDMRDRIAARQRLTPERRARVDSLLGALHDERVGEAQGIDRAGAQVRISRLNQRLDAATRQRRPAAQSLDVPQLQRTLAAQDRALVSYLVGDSTTVAFVVTRDTLVARTLSVGDDGLQRQMRAAGGPWGAADQAVSVGALRALHETLLAPLRDVLPTAGGLVVIPDGPLADLPFGALVERVGEDYASSAFLIERQPVSTELAAALIAPAPRASEDFAVDVVAFGRERFDGSGDDARRGGPVLSNLPYVSAELARISQQVSSEVALDDDATEARFETDAARARVIHVASHAEADPVFPLYSRFYLWDDPDRDDDGVVHLFELQNLSVPAELVVLSGCSTAAGQSQPGEGTIGLQYGIRAGGAQATLATLWPVDDRATAEIVGSFYRALADGASKDVALQRAQVAYLDAHGGAEASPFLWAAPVLSGDPAPIPLHRPTPLWPLALGGVALAVGAGGLAWRARTRRANA